MKELMWRQQIKKLRHAQMPTRDLWQGIADTIQRHPQTRQPPQRFWQPEALAAACVGLCFGYILWSMPQSSSSPSLKLTENMVVHKAPSSVARNNYITTQLAVVENIYQPMGLRQSMYKSTMGARSQHDMSSELDAAVVEIRLAYQENPHAGHLLSLMKNVNDKQKKWL